MKLEVSSQGSDGNFHTGLPAKDWHHRAGGERGLRRHVHQPIGLGQRAEGMGGLLAGGTHLPAFVHDDTHKMPAVSPVGEGLKQSAGMPGQFHDAGALQPQQRRPHQQQKSDQRRNWIARKPKQEFFPPAAEDKWF